MKTLRIWYYAGFKNFGDRLSTYILNHYGRTHNVKFVYTPNKSQADIIGIGSILHSMPSNFRGQVWSTGSLQYPHKARNLGKVWGVRGKLTARKYGGLPVIGDGALLLRHMHPKPVKKKYRLGIIPHYVDRKSVLQMVRPRSDVTILNIHDDPAVFIKKLRQCRCIFSSSLHGLIAADAFGIPNRQFRVPTSNKIRGGFFKYKDYYSAFGLPLPKCIILKKDTPLMTKCYPLTLKHYSRPGMGALQQRLLAVTQEMLATLSR